MSLWIMAFLVLIAPVLSVAGELAPGEGSRTCFQPRDMDGPELKPYCAGDALAAAKVDFEAKLAVARAECERQGKVFEVFGDLMSRCDEIVTTGTAYGITTRCAVNQATRCHE